MYEKFIFIDDVNFFKPNKISHQSEGVLSKLRDKMRKKLVEDEIKEESKNGENTNDKEKNSDINEIKKVRNYGGLGLYARKNVII